jgi:hypothetical protein
MRCGKRGSRDAFPPGIEVRVSRFPGEESQGTWQILGMSLKGRVTVDKCTRSSRSRLIDDLSV